MSDASPARSATRPVLGQRASFWVSAAVVLHTLWTSAAPTVTYPLYAAEWQLSTFTTTAIFAVYPIVLVVLLIVLGDLSDYIGRRATILLGLSASLIGVLLFALAPDVAWIFAGRAFMGTGVALTAGPAAAAMVDFSAPGQAGRASSIATAATAGGLALATIVGGALIQYAPFPTHLNFWVLAVVIAALLGAAWFLPGHSADTAKGRWKPRLPAIPQGLGKIFTVSALAVATSFGFGALYLSLGAQIARDLIGSTNALVAGSSFVLFAVVLGTVAILAKGIRAPLNIAFGAVTTIVSLGLLMLAASQHSLPIYLIATTLGGAGYSLFFLGGLTLISQNAPSTHRGASISAVYLIAYFLQGVTALALGFIATATGLQNAIDLGAPALAILALVTGALALLIGRGKPAV
ncbi:MAG TPA: MFS transporter [Devosiaceae bacterium]